MPKTLLALLLCAVPAALATEEDAGHAPAQRWTHPRGPASGSGRSSARPPSTFGGILWTLRAKKTILAPPVTWDGVAFVVDGTARRASLLAVDTRTGSVLGRTNLKQPGGAPRPAVHDNSVFLLEQGRRLVQYRYGARKLKRRWSFDGGEGASPARVHAGEIYLPTQGGLLRLRAGSRKPAWKVEGSFTGEPAVFKDHVYAVFSGPDGKLMLGAHQRSDGARVGECALGAARATGVRVVVGEDIAAVRLPKRRWAIVSYKLERGAPVLKFARTEELKRQPAAGRGMLLTLNASNAWCLLRVGKRPLSVLVGMEKRPDLVSGTPSCTVLSGILCFGTWAADLSGNRILWHLSERKEIRAFRDGLRWAAVPAGHERLLVVPKKGKKLHAIGPEEIGP